MKILNSILSWVMKKRIHQIELFVKYPWEVQAELLTKLVQTGKHTSFGKDHGFKDITGLKDFRNQVPVSTYEQLFPYIERSIKGEQNVLWPSEIRWFAKSSGTTNAKSKFIPVSDEALEDCHMKGGKDLLSMYFNNHPDSNLFSGKGLTVGGSKQLNQFDVNNKTYYGDVSAVIMQNLPLWAQMVRTPKLDVALLEDWEEKIKKMAAITVAENVTYLVGVPTWTSILLQNILEKEGKDNLLEVWPNMETFFHGAVSFGPYEDLFRKLIPKNEMRYYETYNASEGFFGIQDREGADDMLLMLDYGIFYEFIPLDELDKPDPKALDITEVEVDKNYAMVITTNAGLWRYLIGDTVKFTSLSPFRIKISGRTKHFINAFGEEVIIENAEEALLFACQKTGAMVKDYTAAPIYLQSKKQGGHEWLIEFQKEPNDIDVFATLLDQGLQAVNSDYEAKRQHDIALVKPVIHSVPQGTFFKWLSSKGKLGGQNKVPRLSNTREYVDQIMGALVNS